MSVPNTPTPASKLFSAPPSPQNVGMGYVWDSGVAVPNGGTGAWRALTPADFQPTAVSVNNYVASGGAGQAMITGQVLAANPARTELFIQNVGSGSVLYVKFGVPPVSQQSFNVILSAASTDFGAGGSLSNSTWKGPVSVSGQTRATWYESQ